MEETKEFHEILQTLPKEKTPQGFEISLYEGQWYPFLFIQGIINFQKKFEARYSDLILATFPKSGTTWLKALTFSIANRGKYPLGESPLLTSNSQDLIPNVENEIFGENPIYKLEEFSDPRILATHVSYQSLPRSVKESNCRVVYLCRNPMDQLISLFYFVLVFQKKSFSSDNSSSLLNDYIDMTCKGISSYGPFWDHMLGYWEVSKREPQKVLFLKYEDLKEDVVSNIKVLAEFMGCPFSTEEEKVGVIEEISRLCSFEHLKNLKVNKVDESKAGIVNSAFFRKGSVGDWKNHLSPSMTERMIKLLDEKFEGTGLTFKLSY